MPKGVRKPKWYYADDMKFLQTYVGFGRKRKTRSSRSCNSLTPKPNKIGYIKKVPSSIEDDNITIQYPLSEESSNCLSYENQNFDPSVVQEVNLNTDSYSEYLKTLVPSRIDPNEDPILQFIKGVLPDINKLDERRKRRFKIGLMNILNDLSDEQEGNIASQSKYKNRSHSNMCSILQSDT